MKPLIGLSTNYWSDDEIGIMTELGLPGQDWDLIARDYAKAVEAAGGVPVIIPIVQDAQTLDRIMNMLDGFIFTGGQDIAPEFYGENPNYKMGKIDPIRDIQEIKLARKLFEAMSIPVLGVCRGIQLINVAAGGTVYQDIRSQNKEAFNHSLIQYPKDYPTHDVFIENGTKLFNIYGQTLRVNSFHHEGVKDVAPGFIVSARAEDGIIEGIESAGARYIAAVQWHPEMMFETHREQLKIFSTFVDECKKNM